MDDHGEIARTFDLGTPTREPVLVARGANGLVWRLDTDRGSYAVKRLEPWVVDEPVPFDIEVQRAAIAAGIPMPAPVLTPDGRAMVDRARVYEWVDLGTPWEPPVDRELAREIGALLRSIHDLGVDPGRPVDSWHSVPPTLEDWGDVARQATDAELPWATALASEVDFLADVGASLRLPDREVITCHRDFVPSNVAPSDGRLVVLDWENVGPLTADTELAWVLLWWASDDRRTDLDAAAAIVDGYGTAPRLDRESFTPVLATHLNYLRVCAYNVINGGALAEFAAAPLERLWPDRLRLRLAAIDELLASVGG